MTTLIFRNIAKVAKKDSQEGNLHPTASFEMFTFSWDAKPDIGDLEVAGARA